MLRSIRFNRESIYIRFLHVYMLQGEVPGTVMLGGIYDISQFCEHVFYDWVMFRDKPIQHPYENPVLGRYLGPGIDIVKEMTDNIMKANRDLVNQSTYRGIKGDEKSSHVHILLGKDSDNRIRERFGPEISPDNFPDVSLEDTPLYDM